MSSAVPNPHSCAWSSADPDTSWDIRRGYRGIRLENRYPHSNPEFDFQRGVQSFYGDTAFSCKYLLSFGIRSNTFLSVVSSQAVFCLLMSSMAGEAPYKNASDHVFGKNMDGPAERCFRDQFFFILYLIKCKTDVKIIFSYPFNINKNSL